MSRRQADKAVQDLASDDPARRLAGAEALWALAPYALAALRHSLDVSKEQIERVAADPEIRAEFRSGLIGLKKGKLFQSVALAPRVGVWQLSLDHHPTSRGTLERPLHSAGGVREGLIRRRAPAWIAACPTP